MLEKSFKIGGKDKVFDKLLESDTMYAWQGFFDKKCLIDNCYEKTTGQTTLSKIAFVFEKHTWNFVRKMYHRPSILITFIIDIYLGDDKGDIHDDDDDIPPVLPKKKSSFTVINDDMNTPPPLPAKRDGAAGLFSSPGNAKIIMKYLL